MMESLRVSFQLSEAEFLRAHRAHLRRTLVTGKNLVALTFALGLGMVQAAIFGGEAWALRVFGLLWLGILGFAGYAFLRLPARLYRANDRHSAPQELVLSEQGVQLRQGERVEFLEWQGFTHTVENEEFFFLHPKGRLLVLVPKRALSETGQVDRFRAFLEADTL